ncbi:hypothetical protein BGZ76_011863 [Entomortierella beljakovae]|nr:hypothetical protein BGZ76_011863 [Entomortierella beljakovae]
MIDQACQGLGFGTRAMKLLQKYVLNLQGHQGIKVLMKSFETVHPEDSPEHFFVGLGFIKSKDVQNQDEMIWTP